MAELDVRPGGSALIVMRGPDGTEVPHRGVYLEVVPDARLVYASAFTRAWKPAEMPAAGTGCTGGRGAGSRGPGNGRGVGGRGVGMCLACAGIDG
ncbi:hypothetical protein LBMAG56_27340 [Verrucomicrobiota bacterium]|nr:hypothetical protein LBMAG56_27340 [Verrucomicrobiota bacterium]